MTDDQEEAVLVEMRAAIAKLRPTAFKEFVDLYAEALLRGYQIARWEDRPGDDSKWSDVKVTPAGGRALVGVALNR